MMLTREAADTIRRLVETPGAEGLRIFQASESLNGQGPRLQIALVPAPQPDDAVVETEGALIYLDPAAERTMGDKVLHADIEGGEVRFELLEQTEDGPVE